MTNTSITLAHPSDKNTNTRTHFRAALAQNGKLYTPLVRGGHQALADQSQQHREEISRVNKDGQNSHYPSLLLWTCQMLPLSRVIN